MASGARGATLYLRGLPDEVVRESKARAARRGLTLTAYVAELLERAATDQTADVPVPGDLAEDLAWYREHRARLATEFAGEYVAVVDQQVVDHDREFAPLARRTRERFGERPVLMPKCADAERLVSLPSPRIAGR